MNVINTGGGGTIRDEGGERQTDRQRETDRQIGCEEKLGQNTIWIVVQGLNAAGVRGCVSVSAVRARVMVGHGEAIHKIV